MHTRRIGGWTLQRAPDRSALVEALRRLAGTPRLVLYDLPRDRAPRPAVGSPLYLRTSEEWNHFLAERRRFDDGKLTLIVALRPLAPVERRLAVDWGSRHANMFLLVEPHDPRCDLTDPATWRWRFDKGIHVNPPEPPAARATRETVPQSGSWLTRLRRSYGLWTRWRDTTAEAVPLDLTPDDVTLWDALWRRLRECFPPEAFQTALARLRAHEPELFSGRPLRAACMPFRTRLGLPVPYEPRLVVDAARSLINSGQVWAFEQQPDGRSFCGPTRRIPAEMDEEAVARLVW